MQSSMSGSDLLDVEFFLWMIWKLSFILSQASPMLMVFFSEHVMYASSALMGPLAAYFISLVRHSLMPQCFRDCVLVLVPKKNKDASCNVNYRLIASASSLSKILEHLIPTKFSSFSTLQFGFNPGFSTSLSTGVVKNIVSRYIHNGYYVLGSFLIQARRLIW